MTREELTAMFSEMNADGTTVERQTEIMGAVLDENDRLNTAVETATAAEAAAREDYNKLRAQYVHRFLSGGPDNPGDNSTVTDDGGDMNKRRTFDNLFKEG